MVTVELFVITVELFVIMGPVVWWGPVVVVSSEFSFPWGIGMGMLFGARGLRIFMLLAVSHGQNCVFPVTFWLLNLCLRSLGVAGRLVIIVVLVMGLALMSVRSLRLVGMLMTVVVFLVIVVSRAMVFLMTHARWSSFVPVPVSAMHPIWLFPGHRRWGPMRVDEVK